MKLPRNIAQSKELEKCHHPSLHFVCVLIHGVLEYYAIADADLGKGSSMNMTLLSFLAARGRVLHAWFTMMILRVLLAEAERSIMPPASSSVAMLACLGTSAFRQTILPRSSETARRWHGWQCRSAVAHGTACYLHST